MNRIIGRASGDHGGATFRGWVGVVVETAPNHFAVYEMTDAEGEFSIEREVMQIPGDDLLMKSVYGPPMVDIHVHGMALIQQTGDRPGRWSAPTPAVGS